VPILPDAPIAELLAAGRSHQQTADLLGISKSTVTRRLRNSAELRSLVLQLRSEFLSEISGILIAAVRDDAITTLLDISRNGTSEASRVAACSRLLSEARSYNEAVAVDHRLSILETELADRKRSEDAYRPSVAS
jgi:predicted transcriptional regulator